MKLRLPHPFLLLLGAVLVAAGLTWVLPAGEYQRVANAAGQMLVVPGTYAAVPSNPTGVMALLLAVPRGIVMGTEVIVTILFAGGAWALLDGTGALRRLIGALLGTTAPPRVVVAVVATLFAAGGAAEAMGEEIIAMVPVLIVLARGLGFGVTTALAMSIGAAYVGGTFGPTNPFGGGLALRVAELAPSTSIGLRFALLVVALAVWVGWTLVYARRDTPEPVTASASEAAPSVRDYVSLALAALPIVIYVVGVLKLNWGYNELSGLFLVAGFLIGAAQAYDLRRTTEEFLKGMETMLVAGLFVGVARAISVLLTDAKVIDTIVSGLVAPLDGLPPLLSAAVMIPVHALIHLPVPSTSGQAVLTMPIMAPTADLLGFSRDAAVMAYQGGAVAFDLINPTNGTLLAILLKANVPFGRWLRFAVPGYLLMVLVSLVGVFLLL